MLRDQCQASSGDLFAVRGAQVYRYNNGQWSYLALMGSNSGPVYASDNGISAVFVDGTTIAPTVLLKDYSVGVMAGDGWQRSARWTMHAG